MTPRISVIIPIYNTEQFLKECVGSVLDQSYQDLEIILVDDGSTDLSGMICDQYASRDGRIKVIHQKNEGLSVARNTGVKLASGEYLCFVDSDDRVAPDYIKKLLKNAILYSADVSYCDFLIWDGSSGNCLDYAVEDEPFCMGADKIWNLLTLTGNKSKESVPLIVAWNKLIRTEIAKKIEFPEKRWHEDEFYVHRLFTATTKCVGTKQKLYYYRQRNNSIIGENNRQDIRHLDILDAFLERIMYCRRQKDKALYRKMVTGYRNNIIILYWTFQGTKTAFQLKHRLIKSIFVFPVEKVRMMKSYLIFIINANWFFRKYWNK